jgi:hypothetical protein
MGIEPTTSPLPRECSTTEPQEHIMHFKLKIDYGLGCVKETRLRGREWSGRQDSNLRHPPWKGGALPTELRPHENLVRKVVEREGFEPSKV